MPALSAHLSRCSNTLIRAIARKDRVTAAHAVRVSRGAVQVGQALELSEGDIERLRIAALLHDLGKLEIEDRILKKKSELEEAERAIMRAHPVLGQEILHLFGDELGGAFDESRFIVEGMLYHHERWDGEGYPFGLRGEAIPLLARIISVVDAFDAMVSPRSYKPAGDPVLAYREILGQGGRQFDPDVVEAFARVFEARLPE